MARRHGWANWIPTEVLVRAVPSRERGRARDLVDDLWREPFVEHHPNRGYEIENEAIDVLVEELLDDRGFSEFRIEATLTRFGGFE